MKKNLQKMIISAALLLAVNGTNAQVGIGVPSADIHPSAQLDVSSTSKGLLPPRMTSVQGHSIPNPSAGLMFWCTDCGGLGELQVFNGIDWTNMMGGTAAESGNNNFHFVSPEGPVQIGDNFRGGIIAYILKPWDPGYDSDATHGLIIYPTTLQSTWGCWLSAPTTPNGTAVGTGNQNTMNIIGPNGCSDMNIAARVCADLVYEGYDDWYLPSRDEMYRIWSKRSENGLGALPANYFHWWTSSIMDDYRAYTISWNGLINTNDNTFHATGRYEQQYFRPVRSF